MKSIKKEEGAIMVEATIYMPLVLCTVMALLYLALFNMQEYMMMYQVQRVASVAAREEAYLGYEVFGMGSDNEIDFAWGMDSVPSEEQVTEYYKAYNDKVSDIYREIGGALSAVGVVHENGSGYSGRFVNAAKSASIIALGSISAPEVQIDTGFLGTQITATMTHSIPVPGVLKYLGYEGNTAIRTTAYSYSVNPSEFIRNVDLATDLTSYIMEKLGLSKSYNEFLDKTNDVLSKIL